LSPEILLQKQQKVKEGLEAERAICNYVDFLMSTQNSCNDDWVKPSVHPCKRQFEDIQKNEWDKDYEDLLNAVQRHAQCSIAYCLRNKGQEMKFPVGLISLKNVVSKHTCKMKTSNPKTV